MLEGLLCMIVFMLFCIIFSIWMAIVFMFISPDLIARRKDISEARRQWQDNEKKPPTD